VSKIYSRYGLFRSICLRGPKPVTVPHLGMRKLVRAIEQAKGEPKSDFHGIGVRILGL
jgi:hypothetical protein